MTTKVNKSSANTGGNGKESKETAKKNNLLKTEEITNTKANTVENPVGRKAEEIRQVLTLAEREKNMLPIAERLEKINSLQQKAEKWRKLQEQKKELEKFVLQSEGYTPRLSLTIEEKGMEYTAPIARIFEDVVKVMHATLQRAIDELEAEIIL
jgi:hypothetical protein